MENLSYLAATYETLLHKQFKYVFERNVVFSFQFKTYNFYHLLGFHKMRDSTVAQMLRNNTLNREDFFTYIKNGQIGLDYIDPSLTTEVTDNIVHFSETENIGDLQNVRENRFAYFNEASLKELLLSNVLVEFDPKSCDSEIQAEKLFFTMIANRGKNLNLFIGQDDNEHYYYPSTFFLEIKKDKYKHSNDNVNFPQLKLLSREIVDTNNNQTLHFYVNWWRVFHEVANKEELEVLHAMKSLHGQYVSASHAENLINSLQKTLIGYTQIKRELDNSFPQSHEEARNNKSEIKDISKK